MASYTFPTSPATFIITIISMLLILSAAAAASPTFTKIYAFGDSFTDTGNTKSTTGPSGFLHVSKLPYGTTYFHRPTNRYSDGRLVIDFVAEALSLPYLPPFLEPNANTSHGVNFAVAGSTAIRHDFFVKNNLVIDITPQSLGTQFGMFDRYLQHHGCQGTPSPQCTAVLEDALFWVGEIGVNDYAYTFGSSVSPNTIQTLALRSITRFLQALLNKGAKYVVVQGLPLTGCLPLSMTLYPGPDDRDSYGCAGSVNKLSYTHNILLQAKLRDFRRQYPQAVIIYADYWMAYHAIMKNITRYGFTEPLKVCCGSGFGPYNFDMLETCGSPLASNPCQNPAQFINWDGVHLTEATYKVVADMFLHSGFCSPPFNMMLDSKRRGT